MIKEIRIQLKILDFNMFITQNQLIIHTFIKDVSILHIKII